MAQYFSPRVIFAYHNDADYDVPDRDPEFMANMVVFDDLAGMKRLLVDEPLPKACGSPSFFYKTYGHVDGTEIERYAKLCDWPRMKDCVPAPPPIDYRTTLRAAATKWKEVLFEAVTRAKFQPDDGHERHYNACKLAMGIRREAEIRVDDRANGSLSKFTGDVETLSGRPRVKVLSLNVWHGMEAHPAKHSVSQTAKLILETRADIVGIQEATGLPKDPSKPRERTSNLSKLAAALTEQSGEPWYSYDQGVIVPSEFSYIPWGIVSRLKITAESRGRWGVEVELAAGGQRVWLFNAHLMYFPYQPYQLANIPYDGQPMLVTERDAIDGCKNARGRQVELLMADIKQSVPTGTPYFLTGDFNEPSHLDWTMDALVSGAHPVPCQWPTTHTLTTELGVTDVFRACHADEVSVPAYTWTPRKDWDAFLKPYRVDGEHKNLEHHDRIDFVFAKANGASAFKLIDAVTIGPEMMKKSAANAIVQRTHFKTVEEFPTDHCAVLAEFAL